MIFRGTEATDGVDGAVAPEQARAAQEREHMKCSIVTASKSRYPGDKPNLAVYI